MFTVELKVNGALIGHIYGRNITESPGGKFLYEYEYYEPEIRCVTKGSVRHRREDGIRALVRTILQDIDQK